MIITTVNIYITNMLAKNLLLKGCSNNPEHQHNPISSNAMQMLCLC